MTHVSVIPAFPISPKPSDALEWRFPPDIESEITTLAAWCQVKQQQRKPLSSEDDGESDEGEQVDDCESTNRLVPLSTDTDTRIKQGFLDRLAELLCYSKDVSLITSTALICSEEEVTIVAARNSSSNGSTWSDKDVNMLEYLADLLERTSSDGLCSLSNPQPPSKRMTCVVDIFESHPLPALQETLVEYYSQRIRHHAKEVKSLEKGKTGLEFFEDTNGACDRLASEDLTVYDFAKYVDYLSDSTNFYEEMKANLTPKKLRRVVDELGYIDRPMQGAKVFLSIAQQCSGFQKVKIVLLDSLPSREVEAWPWPERESPVAPQLEAKFCAAVKKRKNVHAEMMLMTYLLSLTGSSSEIFPYLGISKKTCLLCERVIREMGQFKTRGNHGKYYSQWTLPLTLWTNPKTMDKLRNTVQRLRDILREEDDVSARDAEKESVLAAPVPPRCTSERTIFNNMVHDPRLLAREAEWLTASRWRATEAEYAA